MMNSLSKNLSFIALAIATSNTSLAAQQDYNAWNWSGHISGLQINADTAKHEGVDESAIAVGLAGEYFTSGNSMTYSIGFDFITFDDNASFSQLTNKGEKSSDASGGLLYLEVGPQYSFGAASDNYFTARVGVSSMLYASRSISYCSNCYDEDINIDGSAYGILGVGHYFESFSVGLQYQQFFGGDLDNSIGLKIATNF